MTVILRRPAGCELGPRRSSGSRGLVVERAGLSVFPSLQDGPSHGAFGAEQRCGGGGRAGRDIIPAGRLRTTSCQTAPIDCSVRAGPGARRSKLLGARGRQKGVAHSARNVFTGHPGVRGGLRTRVTRRSARQLDGGRGPRLRCGSTRLPLRSAQLQLHDCILHR